MAETTSKATLIEAVSDDLSLRYRGTISGASGTDVTLVELSDIFTEALAPLAAYVCNVADPTLYRRIVDFDDLTGACVVNRAGLSDSAADVYLILTPTKWREACNQALRALYFTDRVTVAFVDGENLYDLQAAAPWIHIREQIEAIRFRWVSGGITREDAAPAYELIQDANAVSILFHWTPANVEDLEIIVEGRHFYEALATEAATTTCPAQLAKARLKVEALRKCYSVMGEQEAKLFFKDEMTRAESELVDVKKQLVPQSQSAPVHAFRQQPGPEFALPNPRW